MIEKYYIYKLTNKLNGKMYVGQHKVRKNETFREYMGKGSAIKEAIKQYGRSNFSKEIIEEIYDEPSRKQVSEKERYWIAELNTMEPNGYNRNPGGIGGCTKESAKKVVATKKARGYKHSEETKRKMSSAAKGRRFSDEHRKHLNEHHRLKTVHIIIFEDGHEEKTTDALTKIASRLNTSQNTLIRHSARKEFINGAYLANINADKYACCAKTKPKSQNKEDYEHEIPANYHVTARDRRL